MTTDSSENKFLLTNEEIEQAMIINRFEMPMLTAFLGLAVNTYGLSNLVLLFERLGHTESQHEFLESCTEIGRNEGVSILHSVRTQVCEEWKYCRRRASDGLGDPKNLIQLLAPIIGPELSKHYGDGQSLNRSFLIISCVFVARSDLGKLCHCDGR